MFGMEQFRLLTDPPLSGPENMARDEALLAGCTSPGAAPVLRLYAWSPPTISLGYFQDYAEYEKLPPPAGELAVVRRTTGGGAILHDLEVTYSISMPLTHPLIRDRPQRLYELAHAAIIAAVGRPVRLLGCDHHACDASPRRGPFFCFARRHGLDVVVDDRSGIGGVSKLAGSAQWRTTRAVLQHGSIILESRYEQQPAATWSSVAGRIGFNEAVERLVPAFEQALGGRLVQSDWRPEEVRAAAGFVARYSGADWSVRRVR